MLKNQKYSYYNRELSWLSFNHRVLQEATNSKIPLFERIKFLAIYHSNLDEFFRVRVAWIKSLTELPEQEQEQLSFNPKLLLEEIFIRVEKDYSTLDDYFYQHMIPELEQNNIRLLNQKRLNSEKEIFLRNYAQSNILPFIQPSLLAKGKINAFLKNRALYLGIQLLDKVTKEKQYAFVEIPTWKSPRFIVFPRDGEHYDYILLDDAVRYLLPDIFPGFDILAIHSFMVNRDAELYINDEVEGNLVEKIRTSLARRESGSPIGFIFDSKMPIEMLKYLVQTFDIEPESVILGSKYLKMADFMSFPNPLTPELEYKKWISLGNRNFDKYDSIFDAIKAKDRLLSFPYQKFDYVVQLLERSVIDPNVTSIYISLYRTSKNSKIANALIKAAKNGKQVTAFVEVKARFDEAANLKWAKEMEDSGIEVIYSLPNIKVHSKLLMIKRIENKIERRYSLISTGNFNTNTAKIYGDFALVTSNDEITDEVNTIFKMFRNELTQMPHFNQLLVSPHEMRLKFYQLIQFEMEQAKLGKNAKMVIKLNSLEDREMINKLYQASQAGVDIHLIVRGICCLVPGVANQSENIKVTSIVDRYLEHARVFHFYHGGEDLVFIGSADWMNRNLSRRIEVITPILEQTVKKQLLRILDLQLRDNVKARIIDTKEDNRFVPRAAEEQKHQSQKESYKYFKSLLTGKPKY